MARTWVETPKKLERIRGIDAAGRRIIGSRNRAPATPAEHPRRILVTELWHIGDVVMSTALLAALRANFPAARITLLAKRHAEELLRNSGLVDEFIDFDFPWTAFEGKYRLSRYRPLKLLRLFRKLRREKFDVTIDCRMDLRSNVVTFLTGAKRRIGYDFGGGSFLLTDALPAKPDEAHKVSDWLALLAPLGVSAAESHPTLTVTAEEREAARKRLRALGLLERPLVMIHPGAREKVRRWDIRNFAAVADHAVRELSADVVVIVDETGYGREFSSPSPVHLIQGSLREMMAAMTLADLFVSNDSGPMHIAAALGVPVIAIFGPQRKEWYGPYGTGHRTVSQEVMPCRPCFDTCIFAEPICMIGVTPLAVTAEMDRHFAGKAE